MPTNWFYDPGKVFKLPDPQNFPSVKWKTKQDGPSSLLKPSFYGERVGTAVISLSVCTLLVSSENIHSVELKGNQLAWDVLEDTETGACLVQNLVATIKPLPTALINNVFLKRKLEGNIQMCTLLEAWTF